MYFFTPDNTSSYGNKFQLQYDNLFQTTFMAEIAYQDFEKLKIAAKGEYFIYEPSTISFAWQRPNFIFTLSGFMDLFDKIVLKSDIYLVGKRTVNSFNEPIPNNNIVLNDNDEVELLNEVVNEPFVYNLKPFLDMNLSAEYRYNKKISGFIQFNNFTGKKYQYWTNFPTQSINILGGITFSF